ncbi:MAG: hypothetical protein ACYC35_22900 [Pirellulales bacterium]
MAYVFSTAGHRDPATPPAPDAPLKFHPPTPSRQADSDLWEIFNRWERLPRSVKRRLAEIARAAKPARRKPKVTQAAADALEASMAPPGPRGEGGQKSTKSEACRPSRPSAHASVYPVETRF